MHTPDFYKYALTVIFLKLLYLLCCYPNYQLLTKTKFKNFIKPLILKTLPLYNINSKKNILLNFSSFSILFVNT